MNEPMESEGEEDKAPALEVVVPSKVATPSDDAAHAKVTITMVIDSLTFDQA